MALEQLAQDLRYAVRSMRRTPGFALTAILCLAIGISVNTAAFSLLNAVMFRDLPGVVRQDELVSVHLGQATARGRSTRENMALVDWEMLRTGLPVFRATAAFARLPLSVRALGEPQAVRGALVSSSYFDVLGTLPAAGRFMTAGDDARDLDHVVVISHRFWTRAFAVRPDIAGQIVTVGTRAFTVIGVAPVGFFGLYAGDVVDPDVGAPELFVPLEAAPFLRAPSAATSPASSPDDRWLQAFGRLRPGATITEAYAQANVVAARLAAAWPVERRGAFAEVRPGGDRPKDAAELLGGLLAVMAVPAILLLVACANLANQLLARAVQRAREIAVRLSLGATRARVVRQLLAETALLALAASALGMLLARWLLDALHAWGPMPLRIAIDARVLAFTTGLGLATAVAFGLAPALRATRTDLAGALKDGAPGSGFRRSRLRSALVVIQIAASLILVAIASVFVRARQQPPSPSLDALAHRELIVAVDLDLLGFDSAGGRAWQQRALDRLGHLPGVAAVGMAPFSMFDQLGSQPVSESGQDAANPEYSDVAEVSGAWFDATHNLPLRGRLFSEAELRVAPSVAVVDEEFAREMWGAADPIGRSLHIGADSSVRIVSVVGVIPTRQEVSYRQAEGVVFIPGSGAYRPRSYFYVRTSGSSTAMVDAVRQAVRTLDTRVPILWVRTLEEAAAQEAAPLTLIASGLASLGTVALGLAALGLFGVLSFLVAQRRYEIGVRVALGARRHDITWLVLRHALGLSAGGVAAGALLAMAVVALLRSVVYGLRPLDLLVFGGMAATMVVVALLASAVPASRAASVDPMVALRTE